MSYKPEPHSFQPMSKKSGVAYQACVYCGLITLKNEFTQWATKQGCNNKEHPSYESKRRLTSPFER